MGEPALDLRDDWKVIAEAHTPEWYEARARYVGASEVACIMGESEYDSALDVWMRKTGRTPEKQSNIQMRKGTLLEELVLDLAADVLAQRWEGVEVTRCGVMVADPVEPHLSATPDSEVRIDGDHRGPGVIEAKYTGLRLWEWRDKYGDEPDLGHQLQLQTQLACTGYRWGAIAVLPERADRPLLFEYERHDEVIAAIRSEVAAFWEYVKRGEEPPLQATPAALKAIRKLHPNDNGETVQLPAEAVKWAAEFEEVKDLLRKLEKRKASLQALICGAIGDATYGELPGGGGYSWKTSERAGYEVATTTVRTLKPLKK